MQPIVATPWVPGPTPSSPKLPAPWEPNPEEIMALSRLDNMIFYLSDAALTQIKLDALGADRVDEYARGNKYGAAYQFSIEDLRGRPPEFIAAFIDIVLSLQLTREDDRIEAYACSLQRRAEYA